jgi:hypothetical protein
MELGNGDAGSPLAESYKFVEGSIDGVIQSLRAGAALGSKECLLELAMIYEYGRHGQNKDPAHGACYENLKEAIDDFDPPRPIPDFDKICPLKQPYQPYQDW